jgi:hypothetical protein
MRTNKERSIILIENPLTGNESFATAMGLKDTLELAKYVRPTDARSVMPRQTWDSAQKVILVRDPVQRLESAVTLAFLNAGSADFSEPFNDLLMSSRGGKPEERTTAVLEFLQSSMDLAPEFFLPQNRWLTAKFDLILATRDIAQYFNTVVGKCCLKKNAIKSNPQYRVFRGSVKSPLLKQVYAEDYALFDRLRVWSPDPRIIRLVEGNCKRCMQNEGKFDSLLDGQQLSEDNDQPETQAEPTHSDEAQTEPEVLHVRAKRKRRKPSTIESELEVIDTDGAEA